MSLSEKFQEYKENTLVIQAAKKFKTSRTYVYQIIDGKRNPTKKKGLEIKNWLQEQLLK